MFSNSYIWRAKFNEMANDFHKEIVEQAKYTLASTVLVI